MQNQIRPIAALKRSNPKFYQLCFNDTIFPAKSKKDRENIGYWKYCWIVLGETIDPDFSFPSFFFKSLNERANVGTITELGRLLLTGYVYGEIPEAKTKEISMFVFRAYKRKTELNQPFNDLQFVEAIKHIRTNLEHYLVNDDKLKYYILKTFFETELDRLLPAKPKILIELKKVEHRFKQIKKQNQRQDKDFYFNRTLFLEDYVSYLQALLNESNLVFQTETEFKNNLRLDCLQRLDELNRIESEYNKTVFNKVNDLMKQLT